MPIRRLRPGLAPQGRVKVDPRSPLAAELRSLWVPSLSSPGELQNLAPWDPFRPMEVGGGPVLDSTVGGPGLLFDGADDYAAKLSNAPMAPGSNFAVTVGIACVLPVVPTSFKCLYALTANDHPGKSFELSLRDTETILVFTGTGHVDATSASIFGAPQAGQLALIIGALDSHSTARISFYEPETGVFQSAVDTAGTTVPTSAAFNFHREQLASWTGGGLPDAGSSANVNILDAWFWNRALSDDEMALWRQDRWSVLTPARRRSTIPVAAVRAGQASQTVSRPAQAATVKAIAKLAGRTGATVTLDSTALTFDNDVVRFDGGTTEFGLAAPAQSAAAKAIASGQAPRILAVPSQSAAATVGGEANREGQASQTVARPTQVASGSAIARGSAAAPLGATGRAATAQATATGQAAQTLAALTQATDTRQRRSAAQAALLSLPDQSGRGVVPPPPAPPREFEPDEPPNLPGTVEDMIARQAGVLPPWFGAPGTVPAVLRIPLAMAGQMASWLYDMIAYAKLQTRISTATEGWLDLIAWDFFGDRIRRRSGQTDDSFRSRIKIEMFRPRATRPAMAAVLRDLTGNEPRIFEPQRPQDAGGIGLPSGLAIGVSGAIGSLGRPGEVFIDVYRDPQAGIPLAAGIGTPVGGIGVPSRLVVASLNEIRGALTEADVYGAVEATRPVGIKTWVRIQLGRPAA